MTESNEGGPLRYLRSLVGLLVGVCSLLTAPGLGVETAGAADSCHTLGGKTRETHPGPCWRPYSDSSPFNRGLGAAPRTLLRSAAIVSRLNGFGDAHGIIGGRADTSSDFDHPLYFSSRSDPVYKIHCVRDWGTCEVEGMRVRIPNKARQAAGGDGSLGVLDRRTDWEYDFWQVRSKPRGVAFCG